MKKIVSLFIIGLLCLMPTFVYAKDEVTITKVELVEKTEDTEIVKEATFEGLNINVDIKMNEVGDYVKYKVTVKNNTDKDYEISPQESSGDAYIKYEYIFPSGKKVIEKNGEEIVYVIVKYAKQVEEVNFRDGVYQESKVINISLSNGQDENPKTGMKKIAFLIILLSLIMVFILTIKWNKSSKVAILLLGVLLVPATIYAVEKLNLTINSKVEIEEENEMCEVLVYAQPTGIGYDNPPIFYNDSPIFYNDSERLKAGMPDPNSENNDRIIKSKYKNGQTLKKALFEIMKEDANVPEEEIEEFTEFFETEFQYIVQDTLFYDLEMVNCIKNEGEQSCIQTVEESFIREHTKPITENEKVRSSKKGCYGPNILPQNDGGER